MVGAVGSTASGGHFGASLGDRGSNVVLYEQVHRLPETAPETYGAMIIHIEQPRRKSLHRPLNSLLRFRAIRIFLDLGADSDLQVPPSAPQGINCGYGPRQHQR